MNEFQKCGSCGRRWKRWSDFILDPEVRLLGLQAFSGLPDANLLVFEHRCGSSVSVLTSRLRQLLPDATIEPTLPNLFGTEQCNRFCQTLSDMTLCDRPCSNAGDRRLIQAVIEMKHKRR